MGGNIFESDVPLETRVLIDQYGDSNEPSEGHREVFFDIEVEIKDGFPEWRTAKNKPIQSYEERYIQLNAVKYVNEIFTYDTEEDLYKKLLDINPDVRILGSDYIGKSFTGDDLDIKIYYHDRNHNYSTTNLRKKIENRLVSYKSVRSIH